MPGLFCDCTAVLSVGSLVVELAAIVAMYRDYYEGSDAVVVAELTISLL